MNDFDFRPERKGRGDNSLDDVLLPEERNALTVTSSHQMDSEQARKTHKQLLEWFLLEKERQAENRMQMAMDADFYDGLQWDPEDAETLQDRGQMPLVYNEVAPMVDWMIGTERRQKVDWKVLPRGEEDVELADVKTKVLKWVSDINRVQYERSRAFADAVKVGVGWLDDGIRDDPTQDILYSQYEDWRCVLWDSQSYKPDLSDARYIFRWRWVDEDIAILMFPDRAEQIRRAALESDRHSDIAWEEETWYTAQDLENLRSGHIYASGFGRPLDPKRRRVRLIEGQFRVPAKVRIIAEGPFKGAIFNEHDGALRQALAMAGGSIIDRLTMRVHVAVFTEADMLSMNASPFRHNQFSLTPIWCYRRSRDRLPYGVIRRVRDIQMDLNKRASKALFMLNTNQIIADEGATEDWAKLRDEADRPDGMIIKKQGKELLLRRDTDAATGQIQMMQLDANQIQRTVGVADENLGRQTNASSGEAIKARQFQGSVVTTEPFDNLRLATQVQGEKQLSLVEQFYTDEKVIRLSGTKGQLEWVRVNQPEIQMDGSVRFINDITATMADFLVAEQDYAGTLRQVMFESLNALAARLPPEVALRVLTIAMDFSDLPNKDEVADQIRKLTGERDPNKPMSPEEQQQAQQQMQMQAEAIEMQRQQAMAALQEQQAKAAKLQAEAQKVQAEVETMMSGGNADEGMQARMDTALNQVRMQAQDQIDRLAQQLAKAQSELANRTLQIDAEANVKREVARIDADAKVRVAEIQRASDEQIQRLEERLAELQRIVQDASQAKPEPAPAPAPAPEPAPAPAAPMTINVQVDAKTGETKKTIKVNRDAQGNITGADVNEE